MSLYTHLHDLLDSFIHFMAAKSVYNLQRLNRVRQEDQTQNKSLEQQKHLVFEMNVSKN